MVKPSLAFFLAATTVWRTAVGLQVTPNSDCASVCMDDPSQDKSDSNVSNTKGSDIVCRDNNYSSPEGLKYKECLTCLSKSTASSTTESDLQWFLYNLRFAFNTCLFGLANATDPISSPCSIKQSCGTLVGPLQDGMDIPSESNQYSYCTAFNGLFMGPRFDPCKRCLTLTSEQHYTANFLVALHAGCTQQPEAGSYIGLDGSLFTKAIVNATTPGTTPAPTGDSHNGGLSLGAYIGIGIAALAVVLAFAASCFIGLRKRAARKHRDTMASGLDQRFGNQRVTAPVPYGYSDPYPPKSSPYESVSEVQMPSRLRHSMMSTKSGTPTTIERYSPRQHHQHTPSSQSIEMSHGVGVAAPYHPGNTASSLPSYSPQAWTPASQNNRQSHSPSPTNTAHTSHSRTHLNRAPSPASDLTDATLTQNGSPNNTSPKNVSPAIVGTGLPKAPPVLPARSNSTTTAASHQFRPARNTRDLSAARDVLDDRSSGRIQITGPIVTVNTRLDEDEDARRKRERERLYREGFKTKKEEEKGSPDDEAWPGTY